MYDCSFLYNTYACVHAYMIYVCTRYSTCVHILLTQYMHIYTHMCACMCARNEMYPKYMHAYVYMHHTQISRYHHSIHQQNAPRACVCRVYVLEPLNHTPHVSRTAAAGASIWVARLLVFFPIFFCYYLISPTAALAMAKREPMPSREVPIPRSSGARGSCRRSLASC